ncbi:Hypothetical predicted protein, partial [Scomber scombrus]
LERKQDYTDRKLQEEKQNREREVKDLKDQLYLKHKQWERKQTDTDRKLQEEKQNRQREVKDLKYQLDSKQKQVNVIIMKCLNEDG